ncbi:MAG: hypothetical protein M1817_003259 [Caeruleum heppii]|nr:MAG: hypothetical protein M1817_003259 [Caeruleum heppii]
MEHLVARQDPASQMPSLLGTIPPPPGVTPNYENPESIADRVIVVNAVFLPLAIIFVILRSFTRIHLTHGFGMDDYALVVSLLLSIAFTSIAIVQTHYGLGMHLWEVPLMTFTPKLLTLIYSSSLTYIPLIFMVKLSWLLLYLRLSPARWYRICIFTLLAILAIYHFIGMMVVAFACSPVRKSWDLTVQGGTCVDSNVNVIFSAAFNVVTDIALLVLPMPTVWAMQLPARQRLALTGVFMTGILYEFLLQRRDICIVSIIRLKEIIPLLYNPDITHMTAVAFIWTTIEVNVGIICACLVTLRPFLRRYFPKVLGITTRAGDNYRRDGYERDQDKGNWSGSSLKAEPYSLSNVRNDSDEAHEGFPGVPQAHTTTVSAARMREARNGDDGRLGSKESAEPLAQRPAPLGIMKTVNLQVSDDGLTDDRSRR